MLNNFSPKAQKSLKTKSDYFFSSLSDNVDAMLGREVKEAGPRPAYFRRIGAGLFT
jgi:hypothetical protein